MHNGHPGSDDIWRYRMMYFRPELVRQVAAELGYRPSTLPFLSYTAIGHQQVVEAVRAVHRSAEASESTLLQEVLLREMLALVLDSFSEVRLNPVTIRDENAPIATARALHTGFYDQSHFTRYFKRFMGVSPGQYQQAIG